MPALREADRSSMRLIGRAVERVEDAALLTGHGRFADDMGERPGTAHAAVLRSPYAHAEIVSLDASAALSMPEVVTVLTGEDVAAWSRPFIAGVKQPMRHYALAVDRVRYAAEDALERIDVEYRELAPMAAPEPDPDSSQNGVARSLDDEPESGHGGEIERVGLLLR